MAIFAVLRATAPEPLHDAIEREFPDDHYRLQNDEWLISANITTKALSDRLGVTGGNGTVGSAIIFKTSTYFGRAPSDVWDWLQIKKAGVFE